MTVCDCCYEQADVRYHVNIGECKQCTGLWLRVCKGLSSDVWVCRKCEYLLRIMASLGWFEMTRIQASTGGDDRFIGSLEMWD